MNEHQPIYKQWHHSPAHIFVSNTAYIVTAGTYNKKLHINTNEKKDLLRTCFFEQAVKFGWQLQAWAIMANHYHFVAFAPPAAHTLSKMIATLHSKTALMINKIDRTPSRKIWFGYWDTCLTFEKSYLARLHYVHSNPVKHGLVSKAEDYPWCSMSWFLNNAKTAFCRKVLSFKIDKISIQDDF
jgi:putative transposase